jgi:mono/diheme cytochrome c family protein
MGVFKFKSTERAAKPTREDLARSIRNGVPGTAMGKIAELKEADIQALTDYVIYLSWRGELERKLIDDAAMELDLEAGDRVVNTEWVDSTVEEEKELFAEQWSITEDYVAEIGEAWLEAEDKVYEVPEPPAGLPVAESHDEFVMLSKGDQAQALAESVEKGRQFFVGKIASCSKCHGEKGLGDGQTMDYDDWTKDWTARVGLDPKDRDSLVPLLARGALPPINALPRNFAEGVFHGGSSSEDLYRRIAVGIAGSPMPAATFVEGEFDKDDVWHLINFIRSLQTAETAPTTSDAPAAANKAPSA